jgi:hypothetical protein
MNPAQLIYDFLKSEPESRYTSVQLAKIFNDYPEKHILKSIAILRKAGCIYKAPRLFIVFIKDSTRPEFDAAQPSYPNGPPTRRQEGDREYKILKVKETAC